MIAFAAFIPIITAILGIIAGNKWITLLSTIAFLYLVGLFTSLPSFIWIILIIIIFLWIINYGKGK